MTPENIDTKNIEQIKSFELIEKTNSSFFLTGKAGTGKTTFLKNAMKSIDKQFVVLAPTGIAAINAGGETLHSFFCLPFNAIGPKDRLAIRENKLNIIKHTDTFIIDEVSMVRCDIIDAIDRTLRKIMCTTSPFGGKQMIFVGDLYQLEPILSNNEDRMLIKDVYNTEKPYFFKAHVFNRLKLASIEFKINYRQEEDRELMEILNDVRAGKISTDNLQRLNSRVKNSPSNDEYIVTLTAHNATADTINSSRLEMIADNQHTYSAVITGKFSTDAKNFETELKLKKGAQIMFTRNDSQGRWANGTLGKVSELTNDSIKVVLENEQEYMVERSTWENNEYSYNPSTKSTSKNVVGTFTQYPVKLAWAITIHKSQGLTFDKVIIDIQRGVFADGQTYVALSRVRSLNGLFLKSEIKSHYIRTGKEVLEFAMEFNNTKLIDQNVSINSLIYNPLKNKEYDKAALLLFEKAYSNFNEGNYSFANELLNSSLDYIICDDLFFDFMENKNISNKLENTVEYAFCCAVFYLYSGEYEKCNSHIQQVLQQYPLDTNAMYIQMRVHSMEGRWSEADSLVDRICELEEQIVPKVYLRGAYINHFILNLPATGILQAVLLAYPNSIDTYLLLQQICREKGYALPLNENILISEFNKEPLNPEFNIQLRTSIVESSEQYIWFYQQLTREVFE